MTLIETAIATALLGVVTIGLLNGLAISTECDLIITEVSAAESMARSQLECIKVSSYIDYSVPSHENYAMVTPLADYTIDIDVTPLAPSTGQPLSPDSDQGLQRITVTVEYQGELVTTLEDYKFNR